MVLRLRFLAAVFAVLGLIVAGGSAFGQHKDKDKDKEKGQDRKAQTDTKPSKGKKQHKPHSGKDLVGDKIKKNGTHKIHEHGKHSAFVNVSQGKIAGVKVKHAEKGDVPVTKYKTTKKMAEGATSRVQFASLVFAQSQYIGTLWIGYGYIDEWGDEVIYWFPYDMILDGDTGAIEYYPAD
jgi:hypothetical protein